VLKRKLLSGALALALCSSASFAQKSDPFKIGVIDDMSGILSELGGKGSLVAVSMAVEDFGGKVLDRKIELVSADHQNRPDIASSIAQEWLDKGGVEAIVTGGASTTSLAIQSMAKSRTSKAVLVSGSMATDISGKACTPNSVQFAPNNFSIAAPLTRTLMEKGLNTWFLTVVDYSAGHAAQAAMTAMVQSAGGKVVGAARFPTDATDYSAYILQAQALQPKVLAVGAGGDQGENVVRTAAEFGLQASGTTIVMATNFITDVHSLGLKTAQGGYIAEAFYWDLNDKTREFGKRFFARLGKMPTQMQASAYAATVHYLQAVQASGTANAAKVISKMKATPVNNAAFQTGYIREDGAYVRPVYVFQIKKPEESQYPWDYYKVVREVPGDAAFQPMKDQGCPNPTK
jgi:branched-chain amino acid transport system substrate-binding protein